MGMGIPEFISRKNRLAEAIAKREGLTPDEVIDRAWEAHERRGPVTPGLLAVLRYWWQEGRLPS